MPVLYDDVCPNIQSFAPYEPGLSIEEIAQRYSLSRVIKMASNENPLGISPRLAKIIEEKKGETFRYPRSGNPRLVAALAEYYHVSPKKIVIGNGSDEIIDLLFRLRCVPGVHNAAAANPCFGIYPTQAKMNNTELKQVPINNDFSINLTGLLNLIDENTRLVFLTSPDNPSGLAIPAQKILQFSKNLPSSCLLIVDQAYIEFADTGYSVLPYIDEYPNIAVIRTFSKVYGLAGLRIGYGIFPPALADYFWRVRLPFSLNILAEETAIEALKDNDFRSATISLVRRGRECLTNELRSLGFDVIPSMANFINVKPPCPLTAADLNNALLRKGIIVRALRSYNMPDRLRISIGTDEENALFISYVKEILENTK